jgi:plastocyanin
MKKSLLIAIVSFLALTLAASAGTLSGSVKGGQGQAVVYLEPVQASAPAPAPAQVYKMDQRGMKFIPSILVVPVGATVEFDNDDAGSHNVRWASIGGQNRFGHNLGTFGAGQKATWKFEHPGAVPLMCTMHELPAWRTPTPMPVWIFNMTAPWARMCSPGAALTFARIQIWWPAWPVARPPWPVTT